MIDAVVQPFLAPVTPTSLSARREPGTGLRWTTAVRVLAMCLLVVGAGAVPGLAQENKEKEARDDFDRALFARRPERCQARFESLLAVQIETIDRACRLTDRQKAKLRLAGTGDIRGFWNRVDVTRENFVLAWGDRDRLADVWPSLQQLQVEIDSKFFTEESLLSKAVAGTLDQVQRDQYQRQQDKRRIFHNEARLRFAVAKLELGMPLRDQQRQQLIDLLLDHVPPHRTLGEDDVPMMMQVMSRCPEQVLQQIFDAAQWGEIRRHLVEGKPKERD